MYAKIVSISFTVHYMTDKQKFWMTKHFAIWIADTMDILMDSSSLLYNSGFGDLFRISNTAIVWEKLFIKVLSKPYIIGMMIVIMLISIKKNKFSHFINLNSSFLFFFTFYILGLYCILWFPISFLIWKDLCPFSKQIWELVFIWSGYQLST